MPSDRCPICKKQSTQKFAPFCTDRCQKIDLNNWFTESYSIAGETENLGDPESTS